MEKDDRKDPIPLGELRWRMRNDREALMAEIAAKNRTLTEHQKTTKKKGKDK